MGEWGVSYWVVTLLSSLVPSESWHVQNAWLTKISTIFNNKFNNLIK